MFSANNALQSSGWEYLLILLCFFICLTGALYLPINQCPDESARRLLSDWIFKRGTLPTGNESETIIAHWGFSYAFRPYLTSIIGAVCMKMASALTGSSRVLLAASRMGSVFAISLCCFFCLRLGHRLFEKRSSAILMAVFVCFLPQVLFLGMYQNNDALSLCAVSMVLYYLVEGYDKKWPVRSCIGLAVSLSLGLLSYYSIYGWLLMGGVFAILAVVTDQKIPDKGRLIAKRTTLIAGICLLLAGWFFLRNAILHDGDFLGIAAEKASRERMREQGYVLFDYHNYRDQGMSIMGFFRFQDYEWIRITMRSFVGTFGYMSIYLPQIRYGIYYAVFGFGTLLFCATALRRRMNRRDWLLTLTMLLSSAITILLSFWQSYARDYQPQGRYIITVVLLLAFMTSYGMDKTELLIAETGEKKRIHLHPAWMITGIWLLLFIQSFFDTMMKMIP